MPGQPHEVTFAQTGSDPRAGSFTLTEEGIHWITCEATDGAGNTTAPESGASKDVEFDVSAPHARVQNYGDLNDSTDDPVPQPLSDHFQRQHAIAVGWSGRDALFFRVNSGLDNFDVRHREAPSGSRTFGGYTERDYQPRPFSGDPDERFGRDTFIEEDGAAVCYSTQGIDGARNFSGYSAEVCTAVPLDDRALSRKGRWTRIRRSGYFSGTLVTSTKIGSTLTSPVVSGEELALLASTGPDGGTIQVRWHGHTKTISLRSTQVSDRKVIPLSGFTGRGRLVIRVSGHGVSAIDGFGVWKRP
jgi:hypothetical protein